MTLPTDAAARKAMPMLRFLTTYFPDAIEELVKLCVQGNIQHNPDRAPEDIVWAREKSTDHLECIMRHLWDHARGTPVDTDEQYHLAKAAWRALAALQLQIEADRTVFDFSQLEFDGLDEGSVRIKAEVDAVKVATPPTGPDDPVMVPVHAEVVCHICGSRQLAGRAECRRCGCKLAPV